MSVVEQGLSRGAMTGAIVYGSTGIFWAMWGASGLPRFTGAIVALVGAVVGLVIVVVAACGRRRARAESEPMTHSRAYRLTMLAEVVAILGGTVVLAAADLAVYIITWTALVVGLHFLVFGRVFSARYHVIGALLVAAAAVGLIADLAGGGPNVLVAVSGLLSALALLGSGAMLLTMARHPEGST